LRGQPRQSKFWRNEALLRLGFLQLLLHHNNDTAHAHINNVNVHPASKYALSEADALPDSTGASRALSNGEIASILEELQNPKGWTFVKRYPPSLCQSPNNNNNNKDTDKSSTMIGAIHVWKRGHDVTQQYRQDTAPFAVKASCIIPAPASTVAGLLLSRDYPNVICKFNPTIHDGRDLEWWKTRTTTSNSRSGSGDHNNPEQHKSNGRVTHVLTKPQFFLQPRDFVCWVQWWDGKEDCQSNKSNNKKKSRLDGLLSPGSKLIVNTPTQHPLAPAPYTAAKTTYCRGKLRGWHYLAPLRSVENGTSSSSSSSSCYCQYTCVHEIDPGGWAPRRLVNVFALRKPVVYMTQLARLAWQTHRAEKQEQQQALQRQISHSTS